MAEFGPESEPQEEAVAANPSSDLLITSAQAKNVRFTTKKNGYAYDQVETFVDQVINTLSFVEKKMLEDHELLVEAKQEIRSQEDTIANLKATIEVFRARGDVLTNRDGSFATASSTASEITRLKAEIEQLKTQLAAAKEDADAGWAAEAELSEYIQKELKPWLDAQSKKTTE